MLKASLPDRRNPGIPKCTLSFLSAFSVPMAATASRLLVVLTAVPLVAALQGVGSWDRSSCAWAAPPGALGHGVGLSASRQGCGASSCQSRQPAMPLLGSSCHGISGSSFVQRRQPQPARSTDWRGSLGRRTASAGVLGLLSQQSPDAEEDLSVAQAEDTEKKVQQFVLGSLAALFTTAIAGYCVYSGQDPITLAKAIAAADPQQFLQDTVTYIESLGPAGYAYFALVYVVAEMLAIPAVPLTASAGYLFGATAGTAVVLLSATIAAGGAFIVGRLFLRQWVEKYILKSRKFTAIDEAISRKGFQLVLLLRLSPLLPFALSNYIYGMTKVNFWEYLLGTLIGFAPGTLGFVLTGQVGRELTGIEGAASGGLPWYGYAAGIAGIVVLGKVVTGVAANAIAEVEEEMKAKRAAKSAEGTLGEVEAEPAATVEGEQNLSKRL